MATDVDPDKKSVLAAELVLGLLEGAELERARMLRRDDPDFAAEVDRWTDRFDPMFAQMPSAAPPPSLERRILASAGIGASNDNQATIWKWATALTGTIAAALAIALFVPSGERVAPVEPPTAPVAMTVAFAIDQGAATLPALVDVSRHQVRMPKGLSIPDGRVAQLWLIEGSSAPKPIGLFEATANGMAATLKVDRAISAGSTLAISIEPPGGSPTGLPTGPVVATGELKPV